MAIGSMIHTFQVQVADVDRGVYEELDLRVAQHPSETVLFMVTRVLAYAMEFADGIAFGAGVSSTDEPAVLIRDLTGRITAWIEVGAPDAERLHHGNRLADRAAVYTHRDPEKVASRWAGQRIHQPETIVLRSFDPGFIDAIAERIERRTSMTVTVTDGRVYVDVNGLSVSSDVHERTAG